MAVTLCEDPDLTLSALLASSPHTAIPTPLCFTDEGLK